VNDGCVGSTRREGGTPTTTLSPRRAIENRTLSVVEGWLSKTVSLLVFGEDVFAEVGRVWVRTFLGEGEAVFDDFGDFVTDGFEVGFAD